MGMALVGILTLAVGTLTAGVRADEIDSRWQPPESIAAAARAAAATAGAGTVEAAAIDERLKLGRCATPLDTKVERAIVRGRARSPSAAATPPRGACSYPCASGATWPCSCSRAMCNPAKC